MLRVSKSEYLFRGWSYPLVWNKYDKQFEQVCKPIQCISMAVLLGCVMLSVLIKAVVNITRICHAVPGGV